VDTAAAERLLAALDCLGLAYERRRHEVPRHARHLAALWGVPLHEAGRATLLEADHRAVLALVSADRKISAPRLRQLLGVAELRVLRGDRGVGRLGWQGLPEPAGALPAVPEMFGASALVERLVLQAPRLIVALGGGSSIALAPADFVRATHATVASFAGTTRLLPEGGLLEDPPPAG
jgi:prolyl-tRNA editing enzyme YbaK/EbsC (Cys-tRNA(Pro) deacylase)